MKKKNGRKIKRVKQRYKPRKMTYLIIGLVTIAIVVALSQQTMKFEERLEYYEAKIDSLDKELEDEEITRAELEAYKIYMQTKKYIEDIAKSASRLLKFGGKFCICHRPERVFDAMTAMRNNGIEPKRLRFVSKKGDSQPWLVLIEGKRGAKNGLKVEAQLVAYNQDGTLSDEMLEITEKYRK